MHRAALGAALLLLLAQLVQGDPEAGKGKLRCNLPSKTDRVIGYTDKFGFSNPGDVIWFNQENAFRTYGPLSQLTMYKAWYYDGAWHNPGEFKGLQTWYGHGAEQSNLQQDELLIGARRPHVPQTFKLWRDEVLVRAEFQWDHIMRWMNFTSNLGRYFAWGFPNVEGATTEIQEAPLPGAYIAAFRGWEGKPLPPELGGYKKRYISQIGIVWAQRDCEGVQPFHPKFGKKPGKPGSASSTQTEASVKAAFSTATQQPVLDARPQATARIATNTAVETPVPPPADGNAPQAPVQAPAPAPAPAPADVQGPAATVPGPAPAPVPAPGPQAGDAANSSAPPSGNRRLQMRP